MTIAKTIPPETLSGLDVHQGDTLHVVAVEASGIVVRIDRFEPGPGPVLGKAAQWLKTSKGAVQLSAAETIDDVRGEFYAAKYGLKS